MHVVNFVFSSLRSHSADYAKITCTNNIFFFYRFLQPVPRGCTVYSSVAVSLDDVTHCFWPTFNMHNNKLLFLLVTLFLTVIDRKILDTMTMAILLHYCSNCWLGKMTFHGVLVLNMFLFTYDTLCPRLNFSLILVCMESPYLKRPA